ncbi:MAG TPA: ATP-binding protein [Thermoanaerobaculaceae bacterium]|nr:ATP-binding protein [Thermoanaerobaculaceae bacterium]
MKATLEQLEAWMQGREDEHLEFKEAKEQLDFDKLTRYCVALANEGGGHIVLGVTDKRPRRVVGTGAYQDLPKLKRDLGQRVRLHIDAAELRHPDGRVVIVSIPPRPIGMPIEYRGAYWMRRGEDLVPMPPEVLKSIFDEAQPDYSAQVCTGARLDDLDPTAIERFRAMWHQHAGNEALLRASAEQLLGDAELLVERGVTYAALILLGSHRGLGRHLGQAETIFEYRSREASIPYQQRKEFRKGFFLYHDELWETINLRNEVFQYREGLFRRDIPAFDEGVVREAILNAISHRDYRLPGSVFVRQFPNRLEIVSPGGLPPGITVENLLWRQAPRNRRLAETFARCGLVERAGQGANLMFERCIRESKPLPDYSDSDDYQVSVVLRSEVQDENFLRFLEKVGQETLSSFATQDFLVLDFIRRGKKIPEHLKDRLPYLLNTGVIETVGRGRGAQYLLSRKFYAFVGAPGEYTRKRGLDRETNKALLLKHIRHNRNQGSPMMDLMQVLPFLSRGQIRHLLEELKASGLIRVVGKARASRWYPLPAIEKRGEQ